MKKRLWVLLLLLALFGAAQAAVDVNTATQSELETVRGIGPALSARIVEARKQGPFKDIEDLQQRVRGIGEASGRKLVQAGLVVGSPKAAAGAGTAGAGAAAIGTTSKSDASPAAGASVTRTTVGKGVVSEVKPGPDKAADQGAPKAPARAAPSTPSGANPPPADSKK